VLRFIRKAWLPVTSAFVGAAIVVGANMAWPHSSDNPYANWPTQAGSVMVTPSQQSMFFKDGQLPHPNLMVIFTCTPTGMRVDQRFLVTTDHATTDYLTVFEEVNYTGRGACGAIWQWRDKTQVTYTEVFASALERSAVWSVLAKGISTLPGDGDAFINQGEVQVVVAEVHDKGLPLGGPILLTEGGMPMPDRPVTP
jgi:hypothetical protein